MKEQANSVHPKTPENVPVGEGEGDLPRETQLAPFPQHSSQHFGMHLGNTESTQVEDPLSSRACTT